MSYADDEALADAIDDELADNPEGVTEYEQHDRRAKQVNPKELLEVQGILRARAARAQGGMFMTGRFVEPTPDTCID